MKRLLLLIALYMMGSIVAYPQTGYTSVIAIVQDQFGTIYQNAPYTVTFFDPGTSGKLPTLSNNSPFQQFYTGYATDSSGNLSITLPDNNAIAAASGATGTQWRFNICTNLGFSNPPVCFNALLTITGSTQNITAALQSVSASLSNVSLTGPISLKPKSSDAIQNVTANGNDSNDGLSLGTAKLTDPGACNALPSGNSTCTSGPGFLFVAPTKFQTNAQTYVSSTGPMLPQFFGFFGGSSMPSAVTKPNFLLSYNSTATGTTSCTAQVLFSPCDDLPHRIEFGNASTGAVIPNTIGLSVVGHGFTTNTAATGYVGNFQVGIGSLVEDSNVANIVHLRSVNGIAYCNGLPNQLDGSGNSRSCFGAEFDLNGNSTDGIWNGTIGNYSGGVSVVTGYPGNATVAFTTGSSSPTSGKGFLTTFYSSGAVNCSFCAYKGGPGSFSPQSVFHASTGSPQGFVAGSGTVTESHNPGDTPSNPTIGVLLDAIGTSGTNETQNSNELVLRAKNAATTGSDWVLRHLASGNNLALAFCTGSTAAIPCTPGPVQFQFTQSSTSPSLSMIGTDQIRIGTDATGPFISSDSNSVPFRILTNNGSANEWFRITSAGGIQLEGPVTQIDAIPTVSIGIPALVAEVNLTTQAANIAATTLYAVPTSGAGIYRISPYIVLTQAATTSSSLPSFQYIYTDTDTSVVETGAAGTVTSSANTVGTVSPLFAGIGITPMTLNAKASTNIQYATTGYASSGATPMQYAIHIRLEYLGP